MKTHPASQQTSANRERNKRRREQHARNRLKTQEGMQITTGDTLPTPVLCVRCELHFTDYYPYYFDEGTWYWVHNTKPPTRPLCRRCRMPHTICRTCRKAPAQGSRTNPQQCPERGQCPECRDKRPAETPKKPCQRCLRSETGHKRRKYCEECAFDPKTPIDYCQRCHLAMTSMDSHRNKCTTRPSRHIQTLGIHKTKLCYPCRQYLLDTDIAQKQIQALLKRRTQKVRTIKGATQSVPAHLVRRMLQHSGGTCPNCQGEFTTYRRYHIDHKHAKAERYKTSQKKDIDNPDNLQILCEDCNQFKGSKTPEQWEYIRGPASFWSRDKSALRRQLIEALQPSTSVTAQTYTQGTLI